MSEPQFIPINNTTIVNFAMVTSVAKHVSTNNSSWEIKYKNGTSEEYDVCTPCEKLLLGKQLSKGAINAALLAD